jgi:hypothetical protein
MAYRALTDSVVVLHFGFLAFVVLGGILAARYRWLIPVHLLAVAWGIYVEAAPGIICPLTPLENRLAEAAGRAGYEGGFVEHYLVPILYPEGLTPTMQGGLALAVFAVNAIVYACVLVRWSRRSPSIAPRDRLVGGGR